MNEILDLLDGKYNLRLIQLPWGVQILVTKNDDVLAANELDLNEIKNSQEDLLLKSISDCIKQIKNIEEHYENKREWHLKSANSRKKEEHAQIKQELNQHYRLPIGDLSEKEKDFYEMVRIHDSDRTMMYEHTTEKLADIKEKIETPDGEIICILHPDSIYEKLKDELTRFCQVGIDYANGPDIAVISSKKE